MCNAALAVLSDIEVEQDTRLDLSFLGCIYHFIILGLGQHLFPVGIYVRV